MAWFKRNKQDKMDIVIEKVDILEIIENNNREKLDNLIKKIDGLIELNKKQYNLIEDIIKENEPEEEITEKPPVNTHETIRKYGVAIDYSPQLKSVNRNGEITTIKGIAKYDIYTLLKLRKYIPKTEYSIRDLAKMCNLNYHTCIRLCAGIEIGKYDHIFNRWVKLQNTVNKPEETVFINNPEKRKENGWG